MKTQLSEASVAEAKYRQELEKKYSVLKLSGTDAADQIMKIEQKIAAKEAQKQEIKEAISAGRSADSTADRVLSELKSAEGWNTWDMFGGGGIITGRIHSESWKESHRSFCSAEFVEKHTPAAQADFLSQEMNTGKTIYMLIDNHPVGIASVYGSLIENLYVLPSEQRKGYGLQLLSYAIQQCVGTPCLWILNNNVGAYRLYTKNGFKGTGNRKQLNDSLCEMELALL